MQTVRPPIPAASRATSAVRAAAIRVGRRPRSSDLAVAGALGLAALVVRLPHLWTVPRFTDETLEVLHSLAIVRDGARPLTNYDTYYGALFNYLVAAALWASGENPLAPRLLVALAGALTVVVTFALGRDLALDALDSGEGRPASSRMAGAIAALMVATSGAHVIVNSHVAWSNCLTPLLTTVGFWLLTRGVGVRSSAGGEADRNPLALAGSGLVFGLALQTHPLVAALLPGALLFAIHRGRALARTPWPYLAGLLFLAGYANVLVYNWEMGWDTVRSAQRIRAEYALDQQASEGYTTALGAMLLLLARILGGAVDHREPPGQYLADPFVLLASVLAVWSMWWLARRRQPLPLLVAGFFLALLPALNPKYGTLLTSRYLMPIFPLIAAASAVFLVHGWRRLTRGRLGRVGHRLPGGAATLGLVALGAVLVAGPLASLQRYYARAFERTDTNERILRLAREIVAARADTGERVVIDDSIGTELPDTGVTELRGFEYLLTFARVPHRAIRVSPSRLEVELGLDGSVLAVLNARAAESAASRLAVTPLDPRPPVERGRMADFRLYRIAPRVAASTLAPESMSAAGARRSDR